ncbi:MAG: hypothetical protein GY928_26010 [Colwellia sp.]|nr:hypothetical protein [Colwellia sp.]
MSVSPMIKLLTFENVVSGAVADLDFHFHEAPGGISYTMEHLNPVNSRRTQDGTLITQTIRYNKKVINLTVSFFSVVTRAYFIALYESGSRFDFSVWSENPSTFVEETEFTGTVQMLSLSEDMDQGSNIRTISMTISEA